MIFPCLHTLSTTDYSTPFYLLWEVIISFSCKILYDVIALRGVCVTHLSLFQSQNTFSSVRYHVEGSGHRLLCVFHDKEYNILSANSIYHSRYIHDAEK